jgi:hypothetical protein
MKIIYHLSFLIGGQFHRRILTNIAKLGMIVEIGNLVATSMENLVTTFLTKPFVKWGLDFIRLINM